MALFPQLLDYVEQHNPEEPDALQRLLADSQQVSRHPDKICGRSIGRLLVLLTRLLNAERALDLGSFTGYSAFCIAEGMNAGGKVWSCDTNPRSLAIARQYQPQFEYGQYVEFLQLGARQLLEQVEAPIDLIFVDADKKSYPYYYQRGLELLRPGGIMLLDNMLWHGEVLNPAAGETSDILDRLNQQIQRDSRVSSCLLSQRDGVQLILKH